MRKLSLQTIDFPLLAATVLLVTMGILCIYSSGVTSQGVMVSREYIKQIIWAATGLVILVFFAFLDYNALRSYSVYIYGAGLLLLLITPLVGKPVNGSRSWIGIGELGIQPSEFAKISTILFLASYFSGIGKGIRELPRFLLGLLFVCIPVGLILLQPDMGTAISYLPVFLFMAFMAGAEPRHLVFCFSFGMLTFTLAAIPSLQGATPKGLAALLVNGTFTRVLLLAGTGITGLAFLGYRTLKQRYFYWIFYASLILFLSFACSLALRSLLKDYQLMRLVIFVNPQLDPKGAGWNILQSITAIGSGGFPGKGFLKGTQSHLRFLPQQSTDFIFSILAEEWGLLGGILVLALFAVIILRGMGIAYESKDDFAMFTGCGIVTMYFFHVLVNVGMAMGIMPVTGIPLLFLSYGGSSLWTAMTGVGILMNIRGRRIRN